MPPLLTAPTPAAGLRLVALLAQAAKAVTPARAPAASNAILALEPN